MSASSAFSSTASSLTFSSSSSSSSPSSSSARRGKRSPYIHLACDFCKARKKRCDWDQQASPSSSSSSSFPTFPRSCSHCKRHERPCIVTAKAKPVTALPAQDVSHSYPPPPNSPHPPSSSRPPLSSLLLPPFPASLAYPEHPLPHLPTPSHPHPPIHSASSFIHPFPPTSNPHPPCPPSLDPSSWDLSPPSSPPSNPTPSPTSPRCFSTHLHADSHSAHTSADDLSASSVAPSTHPSSHPSPNLDSPLPPLRPSIIHSPLSESPPPPPPCCHPPSLSLHTSAPLYLSTYFTLLNRGLYFFLDEPSFYAELHTSDSADPSPVWLLCLSSVLAIGARMCGDTAYADYAYDKARAAAVVFRHAQVTSVEDGVCECAGEPVHRLALVYRACLVLSYYACAMDEGSDEWLDLAAHLFTIDGVEAAVPCAVRMLAALMPNVPAALGHLIEPPADSSAREPQRVASSSSSSSASSSTSLPPHSACARPRPGRPSGDVEVGSVIARLLRQQAAMFPLDRWKSDTSLAVLWRPSASGSCRPSLTFSPFSLHALLAV